MPIKKGEFIEIEFTGKTKDGNIFDSNIEEDAKKINPNANPKPFVFSLGHNMFLKGVEDFLVEKEVGNYEIALTPEKAFGKRDSKKIKIIPMKIFRDHRINPVPGIAFNFDGAVGKVLTVSGGRVIVDFNNLLAGKEVIYNVKVKRKIEDINEKVKALLDFLFRREFDFEVNGKTLTISVEPEMRQFIELFKEKFKEILDLDMEVKEKKAKENEPEKGTDSK